MNQENESAMFASGDAYEAYVGRWSRPVGQLFLDWLGLPNGLAWVDVGCGTGALTGELLERVDPTRVVGVEPSDGFLAVARSSVIDDRVDFVSGDAMDLPLEDQGFDVVVSGLALNFVPDMDKALAEMGRVLKPGGTVAAYLWDYAGEMQLMRHFWDAVIELFPNDAGSDEGKQFPICAPDPLAQLFAASGLANVETRALDVPTLFCDFDDYWSPFLAGQGPAGAYCSGLSSASRERLRQQIMSNLPINDDGSIELIARAWAVRGAHG